MKSVQGESEKTLDEPEEDPSKEKEISSIMSKPEKKHSRNYEEDSYPIWVL
ncbi:MAG: hypothetical protein ACXABV_11290 [Candidatus Thorarchaeota archaeon]|jgi:hypothetical protein